jgi:osmoprotectant transport system substrate-binding protein
VIAALGHRGVRLVVGCAVLLASTNCTSIGSGPSAAPRSRIVVGSFNFPESQVLAEIYAGALRGNGFDAEVARGAGPREILDPALVKGLVDLVPEYAGSALAFFTLSRGPSGGDVGQTHDGLASALASHALVPLAPAPAQDANAIVVTRATAERYGLQTISDLATVAGDLTFGGPTECPSRPLCLRGLGDVYGLSFKRFFPLDTGGPLTLQALRAGSIDVGLLFTTDPAIDANGLVPLVDDLHLQPAENVTPLLRRPVLARYGAGLEALLDRVSARLTTRSLTQLNARLAAGEAPRAVADAWLTDTGVA